jgi:hypothetical protein
MKIMGNNNSFMNKRINYDDLRNLDNNSILISTLPFDKQSVLIKNTINASEENIYVERAIKEKKNIFIYGLNAHDEKIYKKFNQLKKLGHNNTFIYLGGLWEWILLQEVYGKEIFETTGNCEILDFRPVSDREK